MHLEIIFKDPNRKKIFLSKTKTLCAVILSYHLLTWFSCWDIISIPGLTGAVTTFFSDL